MNRETLMSTLFARLTSPPLVYRFTADLFAGQVVLQGVVADTASLFVGMPVSGKGTVTGTVLADLNPVTLSKAPSQTNFGVTLTQGFATTSRRPQAITDGASLPALFLVEGHETYPSAHTGAPRGSALRPQMITLEPYILIYAQTQDPKANANSIMNVLLDGIDQALLPTTGRVLQDLGLSGVDHCRIEGKSLRSPGTDGNVSCIVQLAIEVIQGVDTAPL